MHHYMTKYRDSFGNLVVESWLQLNVFGRAYCFSVKKLKVK